MHALLTRSEGLDQAPFVAVADIVDRQTRARMMAGIGAKNTAPELIVRRALHRRGFRYRLNVRDLPGTPDLVLPRHRAAIFVHGCFWHRHGGCRFAAAPKTREEFWSKKFASNVARDEKAIVALNGAGWRTAVVWECETRSDPEAVLSQLAQWIRSDKRTFSPNQCG